MRDLILEAKNLSFAYRGYPVLHDVSFAAARGDFISVTGSNGAGKSTLLKLLLGELEPDTGEILLMGTPLRGFREWDRLGYVPQNGVSLADGFPATAAEVVEMGLYGKGGRFRLPGRGRHRLAREALAMVDLESCAGRMIGKLSGGQIQRVLIARALAAQSELLLLDEPTSGVDAAAAADFYALLERLNRERGVSVLMVTHDIQNAEACSSHMLCLECGRIVGPAHEPEEVCRHRHSHDHGKGGNAE